MKCVLIISSGEMAEGASELHRMGYELELYPSTRDLSSLKDTREKESAAFIGRDPCSAERSHVRSLRASFIRMLEDRRYAGNDLIIFGESDAVPMVASSRLEAALRKEMKEHPETDIFRLFHHAVWSPQGNPFESDELLFEDFKTGKTDFNTPYVWGTHAMVIPSCKREKVIQVLPIIGCQRILPWRRPTATGSFISGLPVTIYSTSMNGQKKDRPAVLRPVFLPTGA